MSEDLGASSAVVNGERILLHEGFFRKGTFAHAVPFNFIFMHGGLGDYICWSVAIRYVHNFYPHVIPLVWAPEWCQALIANLLSDCPRVKVLDRAKFDTLHTPGTPVIGNVKQNQLLNATGTHLIDLGFSLFTCRNPPPPEADLTYPKLKLAKDSIKLPELPERYCIMTPGATSATRTMPAWAFNELKSYVIAKGITPVFLGKGTLTQTYKTNFSPEYDYTGGIDLRDQTDLLTAGAIIAGAQFTMGLDNGLLHLTACTETPLIFGYTITGPSLRRPVRSRGLILDITVSKEKLSCIDCQENMRFISGLRFTECLYKDYACCSVLFHDQAKEWKQAIDFIMEE